MTRDGLKWFALILAALTIAGSYYAYDSIAPIADLLRRQRGFSQSQIGLLNAVFSLPNIPLAIAGGWIIDRVGAARAAFAAAGLCCLGAGLTAAGDPYAIMVAGRLVFGVGAETLYIALLVGLAQWFSAAGAALAIGLFFSMARVGSYAADTSTSWAASVYARGWQAPLWLAALLTGLSLIAALLYLLLDGQRAPNSIAAPPAGDVRLTDFIGFNRSFWYILCLNVLFASVFFPFRSTFSIQYFQDVRHLSLADAGIANSWVFFAAIFATPVFGLIADRFGKRTLLLTLGAALMPLTFLILGLMHWSLWVTTALMGLSFSVIPAVIWPSTAMLVEPRRIGTAFGLVNMAQSLGLAASNYAAGRLNDAFGAGPGNPGGYGAMLGLFFGLSLLALLATTLLLWRERGGDSHGLDAPARRT